MTIKYGLSSQPKRDRKQQSYDPKNIFIRRAGKDYNLYDIIQAASEDTDIYKTLEKYGTLPSMYKYNKEVVSADFEKLLSLTDIMEINKQAQNMWESLPAGIREQFHNNPEELIKNGRAWMEKEFKEPEIQPVKEPEVEPEGGK